jgi:hypothetical protein
MSDKYQVIVGNVGTVYSGNNRKTAVRTFEGYLQNSKASVGRVAGEPVTLWCDGEIEREHEGEADREDPEGDGPEGCKAIADADLSAYDCDCEACKAIVATIDGRSWKEQVEIAEGLDGGGYEIDEVDPDTLPPALRDLGIDYSIGETELGEIMPDIEGEIGFIMSDADDAPEQIEEVDDGEIIGYRELVGTYRICERDGECYCVSGDSCEWGDAPPGRYFDRDGNLRLCERCGGDSRIDCPGYEFATYGEAIHFDEWIANNEIPDEIGGRWFVRRDGNGWKGSADAAADGGPAKIRIVPVSQSLPRNYARVWSREINGKRYSGWTNWEAGTGGLDSGTFELPFRGTFRFQIYR